MSTHPLATVYDSHYLEEEYPLAATRSRLSEEGSSSEGYGALHVWAAGALGIAAGFVAGLTVSDQKKKEAADRAKAKAASAKAKAKGAVANAADRFASRMRG